MGLDGSCLFSFKLNQKYRLLLHQDQKGLIPNEDIYWELGVVAQGNRCLSPRVHPYCIELLTDYNTKSISPLSTALTGIYQQICQ